MKRTGSSQETKRALAASLKKLMNKKPLSKITINEIVQDCGLNRNSFYYHFEDIYALVKWMLEQEAVEVVKQFDLMLDYREAIQFVMDYVSENRHMVNGAYDAMGREGLKRFFYADFIDIVRLHRWRGGAVRRGRGRGLQEFPRRVLHRGHLRNDPLLVRKRRQRPPEPGADAALSGEHHAQHRPPDAGAAPTALRTGAGFGMNVPAPGDGLRRQTPRTYVFEVCTRSLNL